MITEHARFEMDRRGITEEQVRTVLGTPQQIIEVRPGRQVYQSRMTIGRPPREHLLRVFVDTDRQPAEVVTAYVTSRVEKYWRAG
ncbi:MAG: DUF4258 domain-containing protein [Candidatus Methylomirabilales bacterium]